MPQILEDEYLGDGVYASTDDHQLILDLRGQDSVTRIVLEPEVMAQLVSYYARHQEVIKKMVQGDQS